MAFTLQGDFGRAVFSTSVNDQGQVSSRYLSLNTEAALNFFRKITILKTNIVNNSFGLYSFMKAGRNNKVRFASLTTPRHLFSTRKSGCSWLPKGTVGMNVSDIDVHPIEYNGEQCPDVFYGDCLEKIFGTGNEVRDFFATAEGKVLFGELLNQIYIGLGNSFYDLIWYGQHPLIDDADTNDWYGVDDAEWADFKDQQAAIGGIMTIIDWFKSEGYANFTVPILEDDIAADGSEYIGTATDLFDRVLDAQPTEMKMASKRPSIAGNNMKAVILTDGKTFHKYEKELQAQWNQIPQMFEYYYNGKFCAEVGCEGGIPVEGVLRYKGHLVVSMDEWEAFDNITGTTTFRTMAVTPGNFGIGYDIGTLDQFKGFGLRMVQHLDAPWQGKVYMDTTFKVGVGIVDENFIVNASRTLTPA